MHPFVDSQRVTSPFSGAARGRRLSGEGYSLHWDYSAQGHVRALVIVSLDWVGSEVPSLIEIAPQVLR